MMLGMYHEDMDAAQLVREARRRAGLTQRGLAARVDVSQPLVARIEQGVVQPTFDRLVQLVRACGLDLEVHLVPLDEDAWTLVEEGEAATPEERLARMLAGVDLLEAGRRAREAADG
jgi:transcriptional regulator with XRE-family HTH domain